jgi:DNA-directed RNA polymerase subunit L
MKNNTRYIKYNDNLFIQDNNGDYIKYKKNIIPITSLPLSLRTKTLEFINNRLLFKQYQTQCKDITKIIKSQIPNNEQVNFNTYHIDHKISIFYGFINNIEINDICNLPNLRVIPKQDNLTKNINCVVDDLNKWILTKYNIDPPSNNIIILGNKYNYY